MKTVAVILNTPDDIADISENEIICADAGYRHLKNRVPMCIVGDFDSMCERPDGVQKLTYPVEKNETDGQLALDYAKAQGFDNVVIYGALGGRIEHVLGNLGLLAYAQQIGLTASVKEKSLTIELVSGKFTRNVAKGDHITFYPFAGDVLVAHSVGLYYPLENLLLTAGTSRGISNVATDRTIGLECDGRLLYIRYFGN